MFFAGAVGILPVLAEASPGMGTIDGIGDLWRIAREQIWLHNPDSGLGIS